MKNKLSLIRQVVKFVALAVWSCALHSFAIEGLKLQIRCPDVVLSWPSTTNETYLVQFRETLDTNSSWITLTNFMPPASGTNKTYFVHSNRVDCPPGQVFGMMRASGGGETSLSSSFSLLSSYERVQIKEAREAARLAALYEKCEAEGREPEEWELKNTPPLPPPIEEVRAKILAAKAARASLLSGEMEFSGSGIELFGNSPQNSSHGGGSPEPDCGFYRVVRNGVYIVGLTNGVPLEGTHQFILEVGLDDSFAPVIGFSVSSQADDNPISGMEMPPLGARIEASWNTTQTTNGVYSLIPEVELADGIVVTGAVKTVTVQNSISFPNGYQVAGDALYIQAHTIHTNGTWNMKFYDDQNTYLGFINGNVSAEGFCDYPGIPSPGFSIGLLDNQGNQLPSSFYSVAVTTTAQGGGGSASALSTSSATASATNKVVVERSWMGSTLWAIAYQTVYPLNSAADLDLFSMMGTIVGGVQFSSYGFNSVVNSPFAVTPNPFKLRFASHWGQLAFDLQQQNVRNFYYFGHGAKEWIGNNDINTSINRSTLQFLLKNSPNLLVGTNKHPYRFVFLDGCDTAKGDLVLDFGIPKQTIYATNMIDRYGLRPRAFVGWKSKIGVSVKNTIPQNHKNYIERFFELWPQVNPTTGNYYTLRDALNAAAIDPISNQQYTTLNEDVTIYGCPDLFFAD
jgi:hypothetical protein